jgi:hypothetical protein
MRSLLVFLLLGALGPGRPAASGAEPDGMSLEEVLRIPKVDTHAHIMGFGDSGEEEFVAFLEAHNFTWLDVCVHGLQPDLLRQEIALAQRFHDRHPQRVAWVTSFDLSGWGGTDWERRTIEALGSDFDRGAVGVKVWKEIGMELKDPSGRYVMIDDPRFGGILDFIASRGRTLTAHIGEPHNCWLPLASMSIDGDRDYFRDHPQYHGYLHKEIPDYWKQVKARDRLLERHPRLRVVGCHLGSLEYDVDQLAKRLDRHPNFAVDMAGRIVHFQVQDRDKVRRFILAHQDRLLYGTDNMIGGEEGKGPFDVARAVKDFDAVYRLDYAYFATDDELSVTEVRPGYKTRGLKLPASVIRKIYHDNAVRWYPGLTTAGE